METQSVIESPPPAVHPLKCFSPWNHFEGEPGDLVEIDRTLYSHWAVYIGDGKVIHVCSHNNNSTCSEAQIVQDTLCNVAGSSLVRVNNKEVPALQRNLTALHPKMVLENAKQCLNQKVSHNVMSVTAEQFVTSCKYGSGWSDQMEEDRTDHEEEEEEEEEEEVDAETQLLLSARRGETTKVQALVENAQLHGTNLDVNCKGTNKANLGWTPLHLASYFGHRDVVDILIQAGADLNVVNDVGDTPLHRAAYTGRTDVVTTLISQNADVGIINAEGNSPAAIAMTREIKDLIVAAESTGLRKLEVRFLSAARNGNTERVNEMLKDPNFTNINCTDHFGNTALHAAASRARKAVAVILIQNGIDTSFKNYKGQTALDMAKDQQMKQLLDVQPIKEIQKQIKRHEGIILKKMKLRGWKPFWVVLDRGVMSFFHNRADATTGAHRKSFKYLENSTIVPHPNHGHILQVVFGDKTSVMLAVEADEEGPYKRQLWMNAVRDHVDYHKYYLQGNVSDDEELEDMVPLGSMQDALDGSEAHQQVLEKHVNGITNTINSLMGNRSSSSVDLLQLRVELGQLLETSQKMCSSLGHCLNLFAQQEELRKVQLQQETERSRVLQEALTVLAAEHHVLEQSLGESLSSGGYRTPIPSPKMFEGGGGGVDSDNNDEFFDCDDTDQAKNGFKHKDTESLQNSDGDSLNLADSVPMRFGVVEGQAMKRSSSGVEKSMWGARSRLPVQQFSRSEISVWSILKQCIGKELSKITMPVVFNEPLSFLQRLVEYMEYAKLLEKAANCEDPIKRLEYVSAFAVSATASNWERLGKPFNPLLGETFELERDDLGFRVITEQVSHHPPVSAFHAESKHYNFHGAIHPKLKFWGKSVEVSPKGIVTLTLFKYGEVYTWHNVNCCINNIIIGKLWIELYGSMEVVCHQTNYKAVMNFKQAGWFGKDLHKVEGYIFDSNKKKIRALYGKWVEALYSYDVDVYESHLANHKKEDKNSDDVPDKGSTCNLQLKGQQLLWECHPRPEDTQLYYNMSHYAIMLNELVEGMTEKLPQTDSRLRPDIRKLEEGDIDGAAAEKNRLEEKQRAARKERKKKKEEWTPRFFTLGANPYTGKEDWLYTGDYWNRSSENDVPDIF